MRIPLPAKVARAFCSWGCSTGSGHSAILDDQGRLWMAGCDRWQQLGLGSVHGGSSGYTWPDGGKLWQERFVLSKSIIELFQDKSSSTSTSTATSTTIRDVALGGDHTLILASNQRDVYGFGKGGDGQLGLVGKPFVSAPIKSKVLSEQTIPIAAVCAMEQCSITLDSRGTVRKQAGKCRTATSTGTGTDIINQGLKECIARAKQAGLIESDI